MLSANQTCCKERAWSMAAKRAKYCTPVATRAARVAATRSAGRLPEPSSSMAKWSRSCSDAGSDSRSSQATIAPRGCAAPPPVHVRLLQFDRVDPRRVLFDGRDHGFDQRVAEVVRLQSQVEQLLVLGVVVMLLALHPRVGQM